MSLVMVAESLVAQRGMSQMVDKMVEVELECVKTSPLIAVVVDASFAMFSNTVMKFVLNAAELPGINVLVMILWQLVVILMFVVLRFVSVLIIP